MNLVHGALIVIRLVEQGENPTGQGDEADEAQAEEAEVENDEAWQSASGGYPRDDKGDEVIGVHLTTPASWTACPQRGVE